MFDPEVLASNIKKNRNKLGLKQPELAERLFVSGQAVSKWECGQSVPDLDNLWNLAKIFGISIDKLMGNKAFVHEGKMMIGVDGGGTKTEFVLFVESGHILKRVVLDGSNPNSCGIEKTCSILKQGMDALLQDITEIAGVFVGIAGYFSGENGKRIDEFLGNTYPTLKISVGSDVLNAISSAIEMDKCIAVICGTGFSVYANNKKELHRVGGWGYLLDTKGSGCDIGRDAIRAALAEKDGFGEKTLITSLVEEKLGGDVWKNLDKIYRGGNSYIASFAPIVFNAFQQKDPVAAGIMEENTDRIAMFVNYASRTYDCGEHVVLTGGIFTNSMEMREMLGGKISSDLKMVLPFLPQIYGACFRCLKLYGSYSEHFAEQFAKTYQDSI